MIIFPRCKINLGLNVLKKRSDGFHDLESIMIEVPWEDDIIINNAVKDSFKTEGLEIFGTTNLVLSALELARKYAEIPPLEIVLKKNIPMGAGLGGGSSDAAYFYHYLAKTYFAERLPKQLEEDISSLGSDCAFFISGKSQHCTGRGEILEPIDLHLTGKHIVLVNLGIHISTAFAFQNIVPNPERASILDSISKPIETWKNCIFNDFETPVFEKYPELKHLKEFLYENGAIYTSMTGSGSTVYGIFDSKPKIDFSGFGENNFVEEFVLE